MKLDELATIINDALTTNPEFGNVNVLMLSPNAWSVIDEIAELNQPWGQNIVITGQGITLGPDPATVVIYKAPAPLAASFVETPAGLATSEDFA